MLIINLKIILINIDLNIYTVVTEIIIKKFDLLSLINWKTNNLVTKNMALIKKRQKFFEQLSLYYLFKDNIIVSFNEKKLVQNCPIPRLTFLSNSLLSFTQ